MEISSSEIWNQLVLTYAVNTIWRKEVIVLTSFVIKFTETNKGDIKMVENNKTSYKL